MAGPVVTDFAHDVKACALGQASSSIMARHVVGSSASELRELRETVRKMLKENGSPPPADHKWADIALLEPVRDYKARHASTMLTFDAVVDAIGQIEAKAKQPAAAQGGELKYSSDNAVFLILRSGRSAASRRMRRTPCPHGSRHAQEARSSP